MTPLANAYIRESDLDANEVFYPLHPRVCHNCFLVQLNELATPETLFHEYAYFSSYSESWLEHVKRYVDTVTGKFPLNDNSHVVELASNDGYLLQYFKEKNVRVTGIEPAKNVAEAAVEKGIHTITEFFGSDLARKLKTSGMDADLIIANNVLAHVPSLNDFIGGIRILLKPGGIVTAEFPHLLKLMQENQFDTIYHEHFSYFSFITVQKIFVHHGLKIFDVDQLQTHGGSLRIWACHEYNDAITISPRVDELLETENSACLTHINTYRDFSERVKKIKYDLLELLVRIKKEDKSIAAYGAAAKGNTLLNYAGIGTEIIDFVVDKNPYKQGCYLPGRRIPVKDPELLRTAKPDYILILPWNIKDEIIRQHSYVREWGARFIVPIPEARVLLDNKKMYVL